MNAGHSERTKLHFESTGSGPAIVMLHGWGANMYSWHHLVRPLSASYRVITVDLKGFGDSPKPDDGAYSIFDQVALIRQLLNDLALDSFILVGHSYGGAISLALSIALMDESSHAVRGLVLIGAASYPQDMPPVMKIMKTPLLAHISSSLLTPEFQVRTMLNQLVYDRNVITDEMVAAYARPMKLPGAAKALNQTLRQMQPPNLEQFCARYSTIESPALLIWGREDRIVPLAIGRKLVSALPNATLNIIERCGHIPQEEKPSDVLGMIEAFSSSSIPRDRPHNPQ